MKVELGPNGECFVCFLWKCPIFDVVQLLMMDCKIYRFQTAQIT